MKKTSKILSIFMSLLMVFSIMPITSIESSAGCPHCGSRNYYYENIQYPTCLEDGWAEGYCEHGNNMDGHYDEYFSITLPSPGQHNFDYYSIQSDPTCYEDGYAIYQCNNEFWIGDELRHCNETDTVKLPATGHEYIVVDSKEATCEEDGYKVYQCNNEAYLYTEGYGYNWWYCGERYTEVLPATGHNYYTVETKPTCTTDGIRYQQCKTCNEQVNKTVLPATGHDYTWYTLSVSSCNTDGVSHGYCAVCSHMEVKVTPATGHNYKPVVTAATCTEQGYTTYTCGCGDAYVNDYVEATGHADSDSDGYCDACDKILDPTVECSCNCHNSGISKFFFNFALFFQKIFGSNKTCSCGVAHY